MTLFCCFFGFVFFFWMLVRCTKFSQTQYRGFSGDDFFGTHFFLHSDVKLNFIHVLVVTVFVIINDAFTVVIVVFLVMMTLVTLIKGVRTSIVADIISIFSDFQRPVFLTKNLHGTLCYTVSRQNTIGIYITLLVLIQLIDFEQNATLKSKATDTSKTFIVP